MTAKGYSSATLVAHELGRDLTAPQLDQCADMVAAAEAFIDRQTGKAWLTPSPIADELHTLTDSAIVYLNSRPVLAVTAVKVRAISIGAQDTTLTASTDYELVDAPNGILLVNGFLGASGDIVTGGALHAGSLIKVSYTSTGLLPGDIQRAATLLVAHWLMARLEPDRNGVESYSVGQDLTVKFRKDAGAAPDEVMNILRAHEAVIFA